jgi:hypothetical protein
VPFLEADPAFEQIRIRIPEHRLQIVSSRWCRRRRRFAICAWRAMMREKIYSGAVTARRHQNLDSGRVKASETT